MSSAPLLWFSSRAIFGDWSYKVARNLALQLTKIFQEEPCVSIPVILFINDFAGCKPNNTSDRVFFNLTPELLCRDECIWLFPHTVAGLVFPRTQGVLKSFFLFPTGEASSGYLKTRQMSAKWKKSSWRVLKWLGKSWERWVHSAWKRES